MPASCPIPLDTPAAVHLIGIGGVGMAGLARLLLQLGFRVSGSDSSAGRLTRELAAQGVDIQLGHALSHPPKDVAWAIRTPAVDETNPEVAGLRSRGVPVFVRGVVLAALANRRRGLAVAGAHGKTTTSAMLAHVLRERNLACGYAIGGETSLPGTVADIGQAPEFVYEADESDGSLVEYHPAVAILSCVEWDHVERFATEAALLACYARFAAQSGSLWLREDDALAARAAGHHPSLRRVGLRADADLRLLEAHDDPEGQSLRVSGPNGICEGRLPLPGRHNAWNALLALGAASDCGVQLAEGLAALASFRSVGRRFERIDLGGIPLIHDYAHHPTELRAVIASCRALRPRRIRLAFQPHRYSRTRHLLAEFAAALCDADQIDLLPVYAASELPAQGVDSDALLAACGSRRPVRLWSSLGALADDAAASLRPGDLFLIAGAGDIQRLVSMTQERFLAISRKSVIQ
jgi:UDP-N-acetylmuramate--alanine ligase